MKMIKLKKINPNKSKFGPSFGGKLGVTKFYHIFKNKKYCGEIEYHPIKKEILSIYINGDFRGKGIGTKAIKKLFKKADTDKLYVWSADTSMGFWKKISTTKIKDDYFLIEKTK